MIQASVTCSNDLDYMKQNNTATTPLRDIFFFLQRFEYGLINLDGSDCLL